MNFRSQPAPNPAFAKARWWVSQISPKMIRCHLWRDIRGQGLVHRVSVTTVVKPHSPALGPVLLRPDHFFHTVPTPDQHGVGTYLRARGPSFSDLKNCSMNLLGLIGIKLRLLKTLSFSQRCAQMQATALPLGDYP